MNLEETGKEYVVTQIEKYDEEMEDYNKSQIYNALVIGAEGMYVLMGLLYDTAIARAAIAAMLLAMGLGVALFVKAMLEKVRISDEKKEFIQSQIGNMEIGNNVEGKRR